MQDYPAGRLGRRAACWATGWPVAAARWRQEAAAQDTQASRTSTAIFTYGIVASTCGGFSSTAGGARACALLHSAQCLSAARTCKDRISTNAKDAVTSCKWREASQLRNNSAAAGLKGCANENV
jgi:hypothetical protein